MNSGRYALSQVLEYIHWQTLKRLSARYGTETRVRHFGCRLQLIITPMNSMELLTQSGPIRQWKVWIP
jgi:hypothetical protein